MKLKNILLGGLTLGVATAAPIAVVSCNLKKPDYKFNSGVMYPMLAKDVNLKLVKNKQTDYKMVATIRKEYMVDVYLSSDRDMQKTVAKIKTQLLKLFMSRIPKEIKDKMLKDLEPTIVQEGQFTFAIYLPMFKNVLPEGKFDLKEYVEKWQKDFEQALIDSYTSDKDNKDKLKYTESDDHSLADDETVEFSFTGYLMKIYKEGYKNQTQVQSEVQSNVYVSIGNKQTFDIADLIKQINEKNKFAYKTVKVEIEDSETGKLVNKTLVLMVDIDLVKSDWNDDDSYSPRYHYFFFEKGEKFDGGSGDTTFKNGKSTFIPGFKEQMLGMKTGEEKDIYPKFPENYNSKELAGKRVIFDIKINSILKNLVSDEDFNALGIDGVSDRESFLKHQATKDYDDNLKKSIEEFNKHVQYDEKYLLDADDDHAIAIGDKVSFKYNSFSTRTVYENIGFILDQDINSDETLFSVGDMKVKCNVLDYANLIKENDRDKVTIIRLKDKDGNLLDQWMLVKVIDAYRKDDAGEYKKESGDIKTGDSLSLAIKIIEKDEEVKDDKEYSFRSSEDDASFIDGLNEWAKGKNVSSKEKFENLFLTSDSFPQKDLAKKYVFTTVTLTKVQPLPEWNDDLLKKWSSDQKDEELKKLDTIDKAKKYSEDEFDKNYKSNVAGSIVSKIFEKSEEEKTIKVPQSYVQAQMDAAYKYVVMYYIQNGKGNELQEKRDEVLKMTKQRALSVAASLILHEELVKELKISKKDNETDMDALANYLFDNKIVTMPDSANK